MKSLIAILLLTNCLAYFMFSHVQKRSQLDADQMQKELDTQIVSPQSQSIVLISELSAEQFRAMNAPIGASTELSDELPVGDEPPTADEYPVENDAPLDIDL
jgi:hypothetical protein